MSMALSLVTVAFDPAAGRFPPEPLRDVSGEVVNVVEHFFSYEGTPHLLLIVHHRPAIAATSSPGSSKPNPLANLNADERQGYERLSAWRRARAETDAVPPYVVLNNAQLVDVVRAKPASKSALSKIKGIGDGKISRFGDELLDVVKSLTEATRETAPKETKDDGP